MLAVATAAAGHAGMRGNTAVRLRSLRADIGEMLNWASGLGKRMHGGMEWHHLKQEKDVEQGSTT